MKKSLSVISMMLVLAISMLTGCATTADLEQVQAQEKLIGAKADQAAQDAQAAKAAADAATLKAEEAAARAENAVKMAEERERIADEKAKRADAAFQQSMRK
jgi:murein lipoprotein